MITGPMPCMSARHRNSAVPAEWVWVHPIHGKLYLCEPCAIKRGAPYRAPGATWERVQPPWEPTTPTQKEPS